MTIRLMVVDDHDLYRAGLTQYFEMQPGIEVVAEAANRKELVEKLKAITIDILLLDMTMPGISGVEQITIVRSLYPNLRILVLSAYYDVLSVSSAMNAGASGYISKNCSPKTLLGAVKEVMVMGKYLNRDIADQVAYAAVSTQPKNDGIECLSCENRLNGKTIREWKEDCETFYRENVFHEEITDGLNSKIKMMENENFDLQETIRHQLEKIMPSTEQQKDSPEHNFQNCRIHLVTSTDVAVCLEVNLMCQWVVPFGDRYYCKHPSTKNFAISN